MMIFQSDHMQRSVHRVLGGPLMSISDCFGRRYTQSLWNRCGLSAFAFKHHLSWGLKRDLNELVRMRHVK